MATQLTDNFTLEELLRSDIAKRKGYDEQYEPVDKVKQNLERLCKKALQPLRDALCKHFGKDVPLIVTSGYRCPRLNGDDKVKGAPNSDHLFGNAADLQCPLMTTEELFVFAQKQLSEYDQLIQEFGNWVHIGYRGYNNRNMDLRATRNVKTGKVKYAAA